MAAKTKVDILNIAIIAMIAMVSKETYFNLQFSLEFVRFDLKIYFSLIPQNGIGDEHKMVKWHHRIWW